LKSNINKEERAELLASGKCFACKEAGHIASNCPKSNTMRSSSSSQPEVPSFNIGLDWLDEEDSDGVENLSTLQVFNIDILPAEILPEGKNIETCLGDHHEREKLIRVNATQVPDGTCPARHRKLQAPRKWPEITEIGQPEPSAPKMTSCFAFRGPRQRKEGEGEQEIPEIDRYPKTVTRSMENIGNDDLQIFLGSISVSPPVKDKYEAPFETNSSLSSLSRLGLLYFFGFCLRLFRFISLPFIFSAQTPDETIRLGHVDKLFAPLDKPDSLHSIVPEQSAPTYERTPGNGR